MAEDLVESFSGIRGIYGQGITEDLLKRYLFAYFKLFPKAKKRFLIAGDTRPSTKLLKEAALKTLALCAVKEVIDCGIVPIQTAEYAIQKLKALGGLYITASHNEPKYNGFKFLKEDGAILYVEQSEKIINEVHRAECKELSSLQPDRGGSTKVLNKQNEALRLYVDYVVEKLGALAVRQIRQSKLRVLVDPNGGSASEVLPLIFKKLAVQAEIINSQPGVFGRLIEPNTESLAPLAGRLTGNSFQFACGFDCDADRVELVVDPSSSFARESDPVVNGNYALALACDGFLAGTQNQVVPINDASSYLIREVIKKHHAVVKEVEVGEINVVAEMERQKSAIGGEGSNGGVIVFPIKCRDGIMALALVLKLLSESKKNLLEVLAGYPRFYLKTTKLNCPKQQVLQLQKGIERYFQQLDYTIKKTTTGLKALFDDKSFVWFRQSKTEPGVFRVFADADSKQKAEQLLQKGIKAFHQLKT